MVPFQFDIITSLPSSRPYEHASVRKSKAKSYHCKSGIEPAPKPFSPFSSSSRSLKLRGIFAPIVHFNGRKRRGSRCTGARGGRRILGKIENIGVK